MRFLGCAAACKCTVLQMRLFMQIATAKPHFAAATAHYSLTESTTLRLQLVFRVHGWDGALDFAPSPHEPDTGNLFFENEILKMEMIYNEIGMPDSVGR